MQSFVYSVFLVVVSVIASLLAIGTSGILLVLAMDGGTSPHVTGDEPAADHGAGRAVQSARGDLSFQN